MRRGPLARALARILKGWRFGSGASRPARCVGRPPNSGNWRDREHFEEDAMAAIEALKGRGVYPSQARVAQILHCHKDTVGNEARKHGLVWREMVSGGRLSKRA
jgi:hypothetical protein